MNLQITSVNPLDYGAELKELFNAHERPDFAEYFDRCYPDAVARGARSWVGFDAEGRVVMHVGRIPHHFSLRGETYAGGIVANILVAKEHRSRKPALMLFERMVEDTRREGSIDFLYTDPTERAARVLVAAGFRSIGRMGRFVAPVSDPRWYVDAALRAFVGALRLISNSSVEHHPATGFDPSPFAAPGPRCDLLCAFAPADLYHRRLQGYPSPQDNWYTLGEPGEASARAAVLVRGPDSSGVATVIKLAACPLSSVRTVIAALYPAMRRSGCRRLQIVAPVDSHFSRALTRQGFVLRDSVPLVALATRERGQVIVDAYESWQITQIDCDS